MSVRTRFAPSPTGYLHVGGARTALFNWLYAQRHGGKMVLRLEDTDEKRNTPEAVAAIFDGLAWLGITWDEGPDIGGPHGPYRQSERASIYEKHLETLAKGGHLYEEDGAIRFRSPRETVELDDLVCGKIQFDMSNPATHPDMTIRRPNGSFIFHFVNVVDDLEMGMTHVIRGEDHLSNTPKHIELYRALGAGPPRFAHIPLILNQQGKKLSKRDGGSSLSYFVENGYAPEAVVNALCLLGWSPKDNREELDIGEVSRIFDLAAINRRNAIFDLDKCFWLNGQHLLHMSLERFCELCLPFIRKAGIDPPDREELLRVLSIVQPKVKHLNDVPAWIGWYFRDEVEYDEAARSKILGKPGAKDRLAALSKAFSAVTDWSANHLEAALKSRAVELGLKVGELVHPARIAASGQPVGPGLYEMLELLGRDRVQQRLEAARLIAAE